GKVVGLAAAGEDPTVDLGMERLDPSAQNFRLAGVGGDLDDGQARFDQRGVRTATGQQAHASGRQLPSEVDETPLIGNAQQGPADGDDVAHELVRNAVEFPARLRIAESWWLGFSSSRLRFARGGQAPGSRRREPQPPIRSGAWLRSCCRTL